MEGIIGERIVDIRPLTETELSYLKYDRFEGQTPMVIVLSSGKKLIPIMDMEKNGFGEIGLMMSKGEIGIITIK